MSVDHLLNKDAASQRPAYADDGQGGDTETFPSNVSFRIRISNPTGSEQVIGGREDAVVTHVGYCRPDIDVERNDRLLVGDFRFDVLMVLPPSKAHHLKLLLEELPADADTDVTILIDGIDDIAIVMVNDDLSEELIELVD